MSLRAFGCLLGTGLLVSCQLVAPFGTEELRCPCPEGYDCVDDRCRRGGGTEDTIETCRDGIDNDGDGAIDCLDQDCIDAGACQPFVADCDPFTTSGCPAGLGCSLTRGADGAVATVCRLTGARHVGEPCSRDGDREVLCMPRAACVLEGTGLEAVCQQLCRNDADCPANSLCAIELDEVDYGLCTIPCLPWSPRTRCAREYACRPVSVEETDRTVGGAVTTCLHPAVTPGFGSLVRGEPCDPTSGDPAELCGPDLLCAHVAGSARCLRFCDPRAAIPPTGCAPCYELGLAEGGVLAYGGGPVGFCYGDSP